ncbi:MmcQ/YjbR family DNA-binding protein [Bartonella sp. W8098]|uniref:MmcQ/YjbR family DNA-binding protein n=1 Tax=Bartonella TaxID=773 RepID=UPI0018DE642C|nr:MULTISPECIES: MmcQ/YjbR family DNA-binding protein [Bartonella]MBH9988732.1 MmcQ/YjbR family DNA-binding protein [Bartonella apis]MBI0172648.1 MmcQ/YjbR family DNA-binding protein [Bartonella sp. W8151]
MEGDCRDDAYSREKVCTSVVPRRAIGCRFLSLLDIFSISYGFLKPFPTPIILPKKPERAIIITFYCYPQNYHDRIIYIPTVRKCPSVMIGNLRQSVGYLPAYHMNKDSWISIVLDGTVSMKEICDLIDQSYFLTH